jgi:hypothetical protein
MAQKRVAPWFHHPDVVEQHIVTYLAKVRQQNEKLQMYINKTSAWTHMKRINDWKPFDFYNYFCNQYQDRYRKEYHLSGSLVRAYQRIEDFMLKNNITKKEYKEFIDRAFDRYFNGVNTPHISHICSTYLYSFLQNGHMTTHKEIQKLDVQLIQENKKFEDYMKKHQLYGYAHARQKTVTHL